MRDEVRMLTLPTLWFSASGGHAGKGGWGAIGSEVDPEEVMAEIQADEGHEHHHRVNEDEVRTNTLS